VLFNALFLEQVGTWLYSLKFHTSSWDSNPN
jgi:hypothetical protein